MEEQHRLAKVLWTMDATKKAYQKLIQKTDELVKSQFIVLLSLIFHPVATQMNGGECCA